MAKRLTKADQAILAALVDRYSPELIVREAMRLPSRGLPQIRLKRGRPEEWTSNMANAIAVYVAVEARRKSGHWGNLTKAYDATLEAIRERNGHIEIRPSTVRRLHAIVKKWLAEAEDDPEYLGALKANIAEEKKLQYLPPSKGRVHGGNRLQHKGGYFPNLTEPTWRRRRRDDYEE